MQEITINFGLIASEKFPDVAQERVLTRGTGRESVSGAMLISSGRVRQALTLIGCTVLDYKIHIPKGGEPTLVVKVLYPVSSEKADCAPPSVLQYSKYHRLYEVACWAAQDCVAVLEADGTGVLVGANCSDWGCSFDKTKFITTGE